MSPVLCNYYVTLRCNSKCCFCDIWQKKPSKKEPSIEEIKDNLQDLKKLGVKVIDFTGGEPLLYPHLIEALKEAKKLGFYTTVTTNTLLYPVFAERLKGLVDILQFSVQSINEKEHDRICGVKSFKSVMKSIILAKKIRQKIVLIHTVTNDNADKVGELVEFAQKTKCLLFLNPCFEFFGNDGIIKENASKISKFFGKPYVTLDLAHLELIKRGGNDTKKPLCKAISSTIVISPDNYLLLPCYHHTTKRLKIESNLFEVYNSEEVRKIKKSDGKMPFCKNCSIYCYMRSSFYRKPLSKYPYLYLLSCVNYLGERRRKQF